MNLFTKNVSSLEKIMKWEQTESLKPCNSARVLKGETYSYQVCAVYPETGENWLNRPSLRVRVESPLADDINLYFVKKVNCDFVISQDDDAIVNEPALIPDMLVPVEKQNGLDFYNEYVKTVWVEVNVPENLLCGKYPIDMVFETLDGSDKTVSHFELQVIGQNMPKQSTTYTQWLHADCIADAHSIPVYSEAHWTLIEKYMSLAQKLGINLIYTPIFTPALDTNNGGKRTYCQLLKTKKNGEYFSFDFTLLDRWIDTAKRCGINMFEMSHLFSQAGAGQTPNVLVEVDGVEVEYFTLSQSARSDEYRLFLTEMLTELVCHLKARDIYENCYFHISDEPTDKHIDNYKYAKEIVVPIVDENRIMDALSAYDFYEQGVVKMPVVCVDNIAEYIEKETPNLWGYYCCGDWDKLPNRFIYHPSYRNRIVGLLIYKYNLSGFLHWGFNFYNSNGSIYHDNPLVSTSVGLGYPSGDAFTVYPYKEDVVPSLRGIIFKEALQDVDICKCLEAKIGREQVIKLIDHMAGMSIDFKNYPRNSSYIPSVMEKIKSML